MAPLAVFFSQRQPKKVKQRKRTFSLIFLSLSLCPALEKKKKKGKGRAQTAWERLTTGGFEQCDIKGHPICTAAYAHPHIHKHGLTYLGLLSLKFITSGRTITLFDSVRVCVCECESTARGQQKRKKKFDALDDFLHYCLLFSLTSCLPERVGCLRAKMFYPGDANQNASCSVNIAYKCNFSVTACLSWCSTTARLIRRWISGHLLPHSLISSCSLMRRKPPLPQSSSTLNLKWQY